MPAVLCLAGARPRPFRQAELRGGRCLAWRLASAIDSCLLVAEASVIASDMPALRELQSTSS